MSCCLLQPCSEQDDAEQDAPYGAQDGVSEGEAPSTPADAGDQEDTRTNRMQHDQHEQDSVQVAQAEDPTDAVTHDHPPESTTGVVWLQMLSRPESGCCKQV